jgi:hypothetical protein
MKNFKELFVILTESLSGTIVAISLRKAGKMAGNRVVPPFVEGSTKPKPTSPPKNDPRSLLSQVTMLVGWAALTIAMLGWAKLMWDVLAEGFPTATGLLWTLARVRAVRRKHHILSRCAYAPGSGQPRGDGLLPAKAVAARLGVQPCMIFGWLGLSDPRNAAPRNRPQNPRFESRPIPRYAQNRKLLTWRIRAGKQFKWFVLPNNPTVYAQ